MSSPIPSSAPTTPSKSIVLSKRRKLEGRTQGAISTETREGENRYPSKRSKITLWADEYMALGERTPSEFAAFQRGKENFENSEDSLPSYTSQAVPSSPCTPSKSQSTSQSTSSGVITIRYENHIIFSSSPNSKGTPQEIIRKPTAEYEYRRNKWRLWKLPDGSSRPESNFNKICASIAGIRKVENTEHTRLARQEYIRGDFEKHFSSRKSGKITIMKGDQEIARRYRKHKGIASMWDEYFD
ncbi:hypothetical protein F5882DRAFT_401537 [Hyaloscypha sp. PMI_1271]|nr:hypothetical protein F5882DRAFT_416676 [Hyaloscypha sp. PMI_1271]KAH8789971.1 hypothetical protein F5882DRAFT_401537 [Hyaloscypha sp. PMI_1271]